jgi:DNA-directed RNA polymerase II subunit RPB11
MNAPDRFELFLLGEGEKKIEEKVYSGMSNTSDFILKKEDHTLGNLLSEHIKAHQNVYMAGYKSNFLIKGPALRYICTC